MLNISQNLVLLITTHDVRVLTYPILWTVHGAVTGLLSDREINIDNFCIFP